jgi:magnesium transporter
LLAKDGPTSTPGLGEYIRDIEDHLRRVAARFERSSALMSEMLDANLAQVSLRQNEDMRKISAWVAVLLLPTVLAGIWGMNFENLPEMDWVYGYPVALGTMILGSIILDRRLRKAGWL